MSRSTCLKPLVLLSSALLWRSDAFTVPGKTSASGTSQSKQDPLKISTLAEDTFDMSRMRPSFAFEEEEDLFLTTQQQTFSPDIYIEKQQQQSLAMQGEHQSFDYVSFAKSFPLANNMMIASGKAALADLFAQAEVAHTGLGELDWQRTFVFCLFGAFYQGGFQYLYQVNLFSKLFDVEKFTNQPLAQKIQDVPGLKSLGLQVVLDLMIMTSLYLPVYYCFKASIFSGSLDPTVWLQDGLASYSSHFHHDEVDLLRVWLPADLICFSVPLLLRLPLRQVISLFYTAYLSASSFGH